MLECKVDEKRTIILTDMLVWRLCIHSRFKKRYAPEGRHVKLVPSSSTYLVNGTITKFF